MKTVLTLDDYFALHGRPESQTLIDNAAETVHRWNLLLTLAQKDGVNPAIDPASRNWVASGYRPAGVNAATQNSAHLSKHLTCEACDIRDTAPDRPLARWILAHPQEIEWAGLWFEDFRWTWHEPAGLPWVHGQTKPPASGKRFFVPSTEPPTASELSA